VENLVHAELGFPNTSDWKLELYLTCRKRSSAGWGRQAIFLRWCWDLGAVVSTP